ncbi:MAG TPA: cytochrome c oxidase assembly protein [Bacteroidales bacterium]|nr:cytochrome c oxidase assembly protein [Bacteroidales bacterium]
MTILNMLLSDWVINVPAIVITILLVAFQLFTSRFTFKHNTSLYYAGVLLFVLMTMSPIQALSHSYLFSAHMTQHIFFLLIIPPLLLAGTDEDFLRRTFSRPRSSTAGKILFYPLVTWILGIGSMWIWHIPVLFEAMKASQALMTLQIVSLLVLGYIFIWPVYAPIKFMRLTPPESALYLFSACVGCTVLGIFITFAPVGLYTSFFTGGNAAVEGMITSGWGITQSVDQQMAGLIMWVPACIIYVTNIMISLGKWYMGGATTEVK